MAKRGFWVMLLSAAHFLSPVYLSLTEFKADIRNQNMDPLSSFHSDIEQSSSSPFWPRYPMMGETSGTDDEDGDDEKKKKVSWVKSWWFKRIVQACAVINLISMAMNTPESVMEGSEFNSLFYATLSLDFAVAIVFTVEMVVLIMYLGFRKTRKSYLFRPQCLFNTVMLFLIWLSIVFQLSEIDGFQPNSSYRFVFSCFRAPRALIMLRVFKLFVNFRIPKAVTRRCGRQIWSVTIFFIYFMIFAALIGVQMFGEKNRYCVKNTTDVNNVTYSDIMIPESRCSMRDTSGFDCPQGFKCKQIDRKVFLEDKDYFTNIAYSILTVYESSTQEGWVLVMYQVMDFQFNFLVAVYFVLLIFFVAWLVKNVFIAVVSELFADIRSSYSMKRWKTRRRYTGLSSLVIRDEGAGWHLVSVDHEASKGHAPRPIRQVVHSIYFKYALLLCVLIDAAIQAINFSWRSRAQFFFTILFDLEVLLKIWCVGFRAYLKSRMQLIEFILAAGSTLLSPLVLINKNEYAIFNVMRVVRLVSAIPTLQEFCQKVFGTGKKLGSIVLFTLFFVMVSSVISMQLFLTLKNVEGEYPFGTFGKALANMFQIITQEGWVEILEMLMKSAGETGAAFVAIFLLAYHLFSSLIIMSVFVAVIVDNLEIDEELKILKQKKMGDVSFESQEKLPLRLRIYEHFRENPRLVKMSRLKMQSDFPTPKIRESFMRRFVESRPEKDVLSVGMQQVYKRDTTPNLSQRRPAVTMKLLNYTQPEANRFTKILRKQSTISALIGASNHKRSLAINSPSELSPRGLSSKGGSVFRSTSRRFRAKAAQAPARTTGKIPTSGESFKSVSNMGQKGSATSAGQNTFGGSSGREWDIQLLRERREQAQRKKQAQEETLRENHPFFDQPLLGVSRDSWFRTLLQSIIHARYHIPTWTREKASRNRILTTEKLHKLLASQTYLEWLMILVTVASCLSMMFEQPHRRPFDYRVTSAFEHIFVVAMSLELGVKVLAGGLIFTPNAVIQSFSGVLDVFIYLTSLAHICWQPETVKAGSGAQALLVLRCLRPLRIISLVPKMSQVVVELVGGYKEILKVSALQLILMFIFASYGVQVFSGKLGRCNDKDITTKADCVGTFYMPLKLPRELKNLAGDEPKMLVPRVWKNPRNFNFDTVYDGLLALFEVLSLEGWLEVRDVIDNQLGKTYGFYVHLYVLLGSMIGLTLFVAVVVTNFNENKGIALLTVDQRRWQDLKKRLKLAQPLHMPPRPEDEGVRAKLFDATQSVLYKRVVVLFVLIECVTLAVAKWTSANEHLQKALTSTAAACTLLFVVDAALKIIAFTFRGYWHSRRNRFDLFLTASGVVWAILNFSLTGEAYNASLVMGVVILVFRFLTLSGKHTTLKMLMLTVVMSLVKSFFIIAALFVLILCYALSGVVLFGTVKHGEAINRHANFYTCFNALLLLFRITTGEDWNKIFHDCRIAYPYCTPAANYWESDCGNKAAALVYFISFYVIVCFVFLNLFIAVIIENFSLFYASDEESLTISATDLRDFQRTWNVVDKHRRGVLSVRQAKLVLRLLENRLEITESNFMIFKQMCVEIEKLRNGRDVTFHDVLEVLAYRLVDITRSLQLEELLEREDLEVSIAEEVAIQIIRDWFIRIRKKREEREILKAESSSPGASSVESINTAVNEERVFDRDNETEQFEERDEPRNSYREPDRDLDSVRDRESDFRRKRYRRERDADDSSSDEEERVRSRSDASTLVSKRLSSPAIKLDLPSPPTRRKSSSSKTKVSMVSFVQELPHATETSPTLRQSRTARRRSTPSNTEAAEELVGKVKDWWSQLNE